MKWLILIALYLLLTFKIAVDQTDERYHERTLKDVFVSWLTTFIVVTIFFLSIILFFTLIA